MSKNYKSSNTKSVFAYLPWWMYAGLAAGLFYFFRFEVQDFYFENPSNSPTLAIFDGLIRTKIGLYGGYILEIILLVAALKSFAYHFAKNRFLKKKRNLDSLKQMPWQEFELLVAAVYRKMGYEVTETGLGGADGGIDLIMFSGKEKIIVQCKRWGSTSIGAPIVREMYGLMAHHSADSVKIVCVGKFTREAHSFAEGKPIDLVSGETFLELLKN